MLAQIKRLGTDTAIYGVSTILGRFLNFLLVPFYTNVLLPGEYGVAANVYAIIAFANVVYAYGLESAYFKYSSTREIGSETQNFSTPFISLVLSSGVFSAVLIACAGSLGGMLALPGDPRLVVACSAGMLFFDTVAVIPFAALRMGHKPALFGTLKFLNIAVNVACNIVLLLVFHAGMEGIFISGLIASAFTVVTLLPTIAKNFRWDFSRSLYRALLAFGLPYVPSGLAAIVIQVVDRPVMLYLTNKTTVGVYQANYRLGIFMMLIVSMFDYAWRPFFLSHAAEPGAKKMFARVLTYFVTATSFVLLVLSFFIGDIVRMKFSGHYLIHPSYWGGLSIVPVVLLAYLFLGVYNNLVAGIYIEKKTQKLPAITLAGAAANVAANFLLIPVMGMMGGAVATLLAYMVMAGALYVTVRQFYPVPYEWGRIGKVVLAGGIVEILFLTVNAGELRILWNTALLLLFGALLAVFRFVDPEELQALRSLRHRGPAV